MLQNFLVKTSSSLGKIALDFSAKVVNRDKGVLDKLKGS